LFRAKNGLDGFALQLLKQLAVPVRGHGTHIL
jgi:hypothetical protein